MSEDDSRVTNKQILEEIITIKKELKAIVEATEVRLLLKIEEFNNRLNKIEKENHEIKNKIETLERNQRKNNIVIFGLKREANDISPEFVCNKVSEIIDVTLNESDLNNIYSLGSSGITIANDLTVKQRQENKILRKHLLLARQNKRINCYIKQNKLYLDDDIYTVEELEDIDDITQHITTRNRPSSAPGTPTTLTQQIEQTSEQTSEKQKEQENLILEVRSNTITQTTPGSRKTAIYRPPSTCIKEFNSILKQYISRVKINNNKEEYHIIVGDINLNLLENNDDTSEYLNNLSEYNYHSAINEKTRVQNNEGSCIDHILIRNNNEYRDCLSFTLDLNITDHRSTIINLPIQITRNSSKIKENQSITRINYKTLKADLRNFNWDHFYNIINVENSANFFVEVLSTTIKKHSKTISLRRQEIKRTPWITQGLIKSINRKDELYKCHKKNPHKIEAVTNIKYLGITIDQHMRWDIHSTNVVNTLRKVQQLKIVYYALIESRLSYGILGWGGIANRYLKQLDILQKRFLKIMLNKNNTYPSVSLYSEAHVLDIRKLYVLNVAVILLNNIKCKINYN
ncbi:hypothetical protein NQ318_009976, partial [Aromia moschata]